MSAQKPKSKFTEHRNEKGDIITNHKSIYERDSSWDSTYVFKYPKKHDGYIIFKPYFDIHPFKNESLENAKTNPDYEEINLFENPFSLQDKENWDKRILEHRYQLNLFILFFKEVFNNNTFLEGHMSQFKIFRIILNKSIHKEIEKIIEENGLTKIKDLIYEIIAVAQQFYTKECHFIENSDFKIRIKNIDEETERVAEVLHRIFDSWQDEEPSKHQKLISMNFVFGDGPKKIEDPWLMEEILRQFKNHLERDLPYKNWKKELQRFGVIYDDIKRKLQFKFDLANSLYNLFVVGNFIEVSVKERYPNNVIRPIAQIIELCLVPFSSNSLLKEKIDIVRKWIIRKELEINITHAQIVPDIARISKYFDTEFLNFTNKIITADILYVAYYIKDRFEIPENLFHDLCHIIKSLKEFRLKLGNQLKSSKKHTSFDEFVSLQTLVQSIRLKKKIVSIKFKIEGEKQEYKFKERLPNYLIEQAINNHIKSHEEDFDLDIIKRKFYQNETGHEFFPYLQEEKFHLPHERFQVRFVKSFYNYLLNEFPLGEHDPFPSKKYYAIIAAVMQKSWFFLQVRDPENFIIEKIVHWHSLTKDS